MDRKPLPRPLPEDVLGDKDSNSDYTSDEADNRFLRINLGFVKYGTNDKIQGAAMLLSLLFFMLISIAILIGFWGNKTEWAQNVLQIFGPTLTLVVGVAIGQATSGDKNL